MKLAKTSTIKAVIRKEDQVTEKKITTSPALTVTAMTVLEVVCAVRVTTMAALEVKWAVGVAMVVVVAAAVTVTAMTHVIVGVAAVATL